MSQTLTSSEQQTAPESQSATQPREDSQGGNATPVEMWFDPLCPWAWMTSRWLMEAAQVRNLEVTWSVMSLAVLNSGREGLSEKYQEMMGRAWGPVRVIVGAAKQAGDPERAQQVVKALYDAMGTRIHPGRADVSESFDAVIAEALAEVGLPAEMLELAHSSDLDDDVRASHERAIALVGDDVGTPVIMVEGVAFFGPVVTPAPKGEDAGKLWDGCVLVAGTPGFFELKRSRTQGPVFD